MSQLTKSVTITWLRQPKEGCVVVLHCPVCKSITIAHNSWAIKPENGDNVWCVRVPCSFECSMNEWRINTVVAAYA